VRRRLSVPGWMWTFALGFWGTLGMAGMVVVLFAWHTLAGLLCLVPYALVYIAAESYREREEKP
jgi:hypothetical protein